MIADKGYNNSIEIARSERMGVRPFVSPRAKRRQTQEGFARSDFHYDQKADMYRCPAGEELRTNGKIYHNNTKGKGKSSYRFKRYIKDACATCTMREVCTQSVNGRAIDRPTHQGHVDRNNARVRKYPDVYQLRQELVEHPFGTMKRHWGMDYTFLRGSPKVVAEYTLATICYNLMRMVSVKGITWVEKRLKRLFFKAFAVLSAHRASRAQGATHILQHFICTRKSSIMGNNISVSNISLTGQNVDEDTPMSNLTSLGKTRGESWEVRTTGMRHGSLSNTASEYPANGNMPGCTM